MVSLVSTDYKQCANAQRVKSPTFLGKSKQVADYQHVRVCKMLGILGEQRLIEYSSELQRQDLVT